MAGRTVVVGAGLAGLSAAIHLAGAGREVVVVEAEAVPGGRSGTVAVGGYRFDTGPSVLTVPEVVRSTVGAAGEELEDWLELRPLDPIYRIGFHDGSRLDIVPGAERMAAEVERLAGPEEAGRYLAFRDHLGRMLEAEWGPFIDRNYDGPADLARPLALLRLARLGGYRRRGLLPGRRRHARPPPGPGRGGREGRGVVPLVDPGRAGRGRARRGHRGGAGRRGAPSRRRRGRDQRPPGRLRPPAPPGGPRLAGPVAAAPLLPLLLPGPPGPDPPARGPGPPLRPPGPGLEGHLRGPDPPPGRPVRPEPARHLPLARGPRRRPARPRHPVRPRADGQHPGRPGLGRGRAAPARAALRPPGRPRLRRPAPRQRGRAGRRPARLGGAGPDRGHPVLPRP